MTEKTPPIDLFSSVSVIITPHENGFTLGIIDSKPDDERDVCSYVAKGMVQVAIDEPDYLYQKGFEAFKKKAEETNGKNEDNVIDLITHRDKKDLN